ncbi:Tm-1-like ATP-binding domain-containing protein [Kribbella sp. NPDC003557]|uniref:Tm-1-like ATP-binding domain-containing protein n=1 Tax=Kribbella sp. NPDC003557 TaxID=3154449 RepID=UPI0033B8AF3E
MTVIALVGALDTKAEEYRFLADRIEQLGASWILLDIGVLGEPGLTATYDAGTIARHGGGRLDSLRTVADRNEAMRVMAAGAGRVLGDPAVGVDGVVAVGGSNAAYVMAEICAVLPFGLPKVLVSTIAAGDTRRYVREADLTLMYPVVDINGLNRLTRSVLTNAAAACVAMASAPKEQASDRPVVGVTMFGVTTACASAVAQGLTRRGYEALSFHCTGVGGRSMEALIRKGSVQAVADLTTTELADDLVGGVCSAGPDRLTAAAAAGVPQVVSLGALDMVNFTGPESVPARFRNRRLYPHNPAVTLMRTTADECAELGRRIADRLNTATARTAVLIPRRGLSQLSVPGGPFHDPVADQALFDSLRAGLSPTIAVHDFDTDINDPVVSATAVDLLATWLDKGPS